MQNIENFLIPRTKVFIHGTPERNVEPILERKEFWGHYFVIDDKERECEIERFYDSLMGSIYTSLGHSKPDLLYDSGRFYASSAPSLIVIAGRDEDVYCDSEIVFHVTYKNHTLFSDSTFRVIHDPVIKRMNRTSVFPVMFGVEDMNRLSERFQRHEDQFKDYTEKLIWAYNQIIRCMIRRINKRLEVRKKD